MKLGVPALAVAFIAAATFSTLLPLRQSAVGPEDIADRVIEDFRPEIQGENVLFLGRDNFISWELLGAEDVFSPLLNHYDTEETPTLYRATPINAKFDWDNVPPETLADFDFVITTSSAFNSEAPPEFRPAVRSGDFILWERTAPGTGDRRTLLEPLFPGASVDCSDPAKGPLAGVAGQATVLPAAPAVGQIWSPRPNITDATGATQELLLAPGRWEISMQFASTRRSADRRAVGRPRRRAAREPALPRPVPLLHRRRDRGPRRRRRRQGPGHLRGHRGGAAADRPPARHRDPRLPRPDRRDTGWASASAFRWPRSADATSTSTSPTIRLIRPLQASRPRKSRILRRTGGTSDPTGVSRPGRWTHHAEPIG